MANSLETLERQRAEILRQMQQWEICDAAASWNSICAVAAGVGKASEMVLPATL